MDTSTDPLRTEDHGEIAALENAIIHAYGLTEAISSAATDGDAAAD